MIEILPPTHVVAIEKIGAAYAVAPSTPSWAAPPPVRFNATCCNCSWRTHGNHSTRTGAEYDARLHIETELRAEWIEGPYAFSGWRMGAAGCRRD